MYFVDHFMIQLRARQLHLDMYERTRELLDQQGKS